MKTPRVSMTFFRTLGIMVFIIIVVNAVLCQNVTRHNTLNQIFLRETALADPLLKNADSIIEMGVTEKSLYRLSHLCQQILASSRDIVEVAIIDQQGQILAHQDMQKVGRTETAIPAIANKSRLFWETPKSLDAYLQVRSAPVGLVPAGFGLHPPFYVKISVSKNLLIQQSRVVFFVALLCSIAAILVLLVVVFVLTNTILGKRIAQILDGFDALAAGKLDIRLSTYGSDNPKSKWGIKPGRPYDELDFLMQSFNKMAVQLQEIDAKRQEQEKQLGFLANHDQLTGLPNRRLLENALRKGIARARRGMPSTFIMMDLDNFKVVNDTMGHTIGDQVLVTFARLLQKQLREYDLLARTGGDEFALLLRDEDIHEAKAIADRICQVIGEQRFVFNNRSFHLGLSIGLAPIDGTYNQETLLFQADTAMYTAKRQGRNRVVVYYPDDNTMLQLSRTNEIVSLIKDALEEDGFLIYYQPVVSLRDNQIKYYEALIRLKAHVGGHDTIINPDAFLPAAEQFGLMPQIDRWVVRHVLYTLQKSSDVRIFVNLSGNSLDDESLLADIEDSLLQYGVDPGRIGFEITETSVIRDLKSAQEWINRLGTLGCSFSLDDFGAGFNSFSYLRNLSINQLKLDGAFISALDNDATLQYLVRAMQDLAKGLNLETVAEFVGNAKTVQILKEIGVTYGQGYYLGKPSPYFL